MNDKNVHNELPSSPQKLETQWVMVFNLITAKGKEEDKKTYRVNKKRLIIGSALSSDIRIQQNAVSNVHAVVEMDESGQAHVYDMASETGIFVNGKKVVNHDLKDGDELKIGFSTLTYKRMQVQDIPASGMRSSASGSRKLFVDTKEDFRPLILEDERNVIQIFDYPSSSQQALQVVEHWGNVILDVQHFVDDKKVVLGENRKDSFCVPGMAGAHPFVTFEGGAQLEFAPGMTGVVRSGRKLIPLSELGSNRFHLQQNDLAKITFKDLTFFVSYSPLPPHLKRQRVLERDPFYFRILFSSLLLTAAFVVLLLGIEPNKKLETEELPPRVATIIFKQPPPPPPPPVVEKKPPPPKQEVKPEPKPMPPPPMPKPMVTPPKKLPVEVKPAPMVRTTPTEKPQTSANQTKGAAPTPRGGNEGEGAKAKGPEGKKGEPNKPKAPVHMNSSRGNPSAPTNAKSLAKGQGNVEALFNDIGGNISQKMAAAGKGASAAGQKLTGYGAFTTEGNGGLGQAGTGSGGGGESLTVSGAGTKGIGDGAKGNGVGAIGSGGDISGTGRGRPNVQIGNAAETIVLGGLDRGIIDEYIKRHMRQIRNCYEQQLKGAPGLAGRVSTQFVISGTGRVTSAGVESSSMGNSAVESCLVGVLKRIVFPEPVGGGIVEVKYPFAFTPSVSGN